MLSLSTQPISGSHAIFNPSQDCLESESPCVQNVEGFAHMSVGCPQPKDAVFVSAALDIERFDFFDCHRRIGIGGSVGFIICPIGICPWWIAGDNSEWPLW